MFISWYLFDGWSFGGVQIFVFHKSSPATESTVHRQVRYATLIQANDEKNYVQKSKHLRKKIKLHLILNQQSNNFIKHCPCSNTIIK